MTDEGVHVEFDLTGIDTYTLKVNPLGQAAAQRSGQLDASCSLTSARLFIEADDSANDHRLFFNRIHVPEPETQGAACAAVAAVAALRVRQRMLARR